MNKEEAGIAEQYHIAGHNTFFDGWNKSIGGETLLFGDKHPRYTGFDKKSYMKEYNLLPERKTKVKTYQQTLKYKAYKKEYMKEYNQKPEVITKKKEHNKACRLRKKLALSTT